MKSRSREIGSLNYHIASKFDRHIHNTDAGVPVKFQSYCTILNANLAASRLCEIVQWDALSDIEMGRSMRITSLQLQQSPPSNKSRCLALIAMIHVPVERLGVSHHLTPGKPGCHFKTAVFNLVLLIGIFTSSKDNALRWMPLDLTDGKSTLVQVMAWCRQATSHYLSQCWPSSMSPYGVNNLTICSTSGLIFTNITS